MDAAATCAMYATQAHFKAAMTAYFENGVQVSRAAAEVISCMQNACMPDAKECASKKAVNVSSEHRK